MVVALGILLAVAVLTALFFGFQSSQAKAAAARSGSELEGIRARLEKVETEAKRSAESLDEKRKALDEAREKVKSLKQRRHEERDAARVKKEIDDAGAELERQMEHKLAQAREETEMSKAAVKRLTAEVEALKARGSRSEKAERRAEKPAEAAAPAQASAPAAAPASPREQSPEERARLESAERGLSKAKARIDELEAEVKKARGRAETDRRVFVVQKGELEMAKDKFRSLEGRFNALTLERDEAKKTLWMLEKEMKALRPTAEPVEKPAEQPKAEEKAEEEKPAEGSAA